MTNHANIHGTDGGSVTKVLPKKIRPDFIGKLIKLEAEHADNPAIFERLCVAVQQCRGYNAGSPETRERLMPYMIQTQQELARLGVMVG